MPASDYDYSSCAVAIIGTAREVGDGQMAGLCCRLLVNLKLISLCCLYKQHATVRGTFARSDIIPATPTA